MSQKQTKHTPVSLPPEMINTNVFWCAARLKVKGAATFVKKKEAEHGFTASYNTTEGRHNPTNGAADQSVNKKFFVPNSGHHIHWPVSGLSGTQSASVSAEGGSLSGLSDTFSQKDKAKVPNMSQTGAGLDGHFARPFAHETFSAVGGVAQPKPDVPWTAPGLHPHGVYPGFAPLGTHNFSLDTSYHGNYPVQKGH